MDSITELANELGYEQQEKEEEKEEIKEEGSKAQKEKRVREALRQIANKQEMETYSLRNINWSKEEDKYNNSWKRIKRKTIGQIKESPKVFDEEELFFVAHCQDIIEGKPQLIEDTRKLIPLVSKFRKKSVIKGIESIKDSIKFIDDNIDKRTDGYELNTLNIPLWVYRIVHDSMDEYIVFSEKKLGLDYAKFKGMEMQITQTSELAKDLKVRGTARIFFVKEFYSSIVTMPKEECVKLTQRLNKTIGLTQEKFFDFLYAHEDGKIYRHSKYYEMLRVSQLLSGKYEGYPLHVINMGPPGKGKTVEIEALDYKFREDSGILEAANSTIKALSPSFKEKPAEPGYILRCFRIGLIDELMKMVKKTMDSSRSDQRTMGGLNELNALLEHKVRNIGSGNNNFMVISPSSKIIFGTNVLEGKDYLIQHLGAVDSSMISRTIVNCYDKNESDFISGNKPTKYKFIKKIKKNHSSNNLLYSVCVDGDETKEFDYDIQDIFISLYDSCQKFISDIDEDVVIEIAKGCLSSAETELKDIYEKRLPHHAHLILDGIIKFRCLFKDFDISFKAKEEDYKLLEECLNNIVRSWRFPVSARRKLL